MEDLDAESELALVEAAHEAWNNGDIDKMLGCYVEDVIQITNTGNLGPTVIHGKQAFRAKYEPVMQIIEAKTYIIDFKFFGEVARIRFQTYIRHLTTGYEFVGNYREFCTFRDGKISVIEDFHDADRINAFWQMVQANSSDEST